MNHLRGNAGQATWQLNWARYKPMLSQDGKEFQKLAPPVCLLRWDASTFIALPLGPITTTKSGGDIQVYKLRPQ